jgi:hypothetical protein
LAEVKGVGGGADEGVLIQDLLGEGADQGLAAELAVVILFGVLEDVGDMQGSLGGSEYVYYYIHIRLTFRLGGGGFAVLGTAQGAHGTELRKAGGFKDFEEVVFS